MTIRLQMNFWGLWLNSNYIYVHQIL